MSSRDGETQSLSGDNYHSSLPGKLFSTRYKIALLGFLGYVLLFAMRASISVAIVAMVANQKADNSSFSENCPENSMNKSAEQIQTEKLLVDDQPLEGKFDWTSTQQAYVLAAFFYGNCMLQFCGGYFASKFGGKHLYGFGFLIRAILFMLNPLIAYLGVQVLIIVKITEGVIEAVTMPAFHHLTSRWAPKFERSIFAGLAISGFAFGTMFGQLIAGILCSFRFLNGWPLVFLLLGFLGFIWFGLWMYTAYNSPDKHPRISESEREFINKFTQVDDNKKHKIPWKSIATSPRFIGLLFGHMAQNTICYGIMTSLPLYLSNVLNFDIQGDGFFSAVPWLCCFLGVISSSQLTDFLRRRKYVTTTFIRKSNQITGCVIPAIFLASAGYSGCNATLAVSFITVGMYLFGFAYSGCYCNHLDIAPYFAGTLFGITNTFAVMPGTYC